MDFIDDFIKEYKSNPCLWKADCSDFKNRTKRQEAYIKLIDVATKHGEHYNVERTKQKINNLRCAFRHQLKKYNEVKKKGEQYEPYCPKRRYFESLMFLKDEEIADKRAKREPNGESQEKYKENTDICVQSEICDDYSQSNGLEKKFCDSGKISVNSSGFCTKIFEEAVNKAEPNQPNISKRTNVSIKEVEVLVPASNIEEKDKNSINNLSNSLEREQIGSFEFEKDTINPKSIKRICRKRSLSISSQVSNEADPINKPVKADISSVDFEKLFSLAFKNVSNNVDDHFTNFGKIIAHKLRHMDSTQAIYAEKIIADVLYQGQMKMLSTLSIQQLQNIDSSSNVYAENHNK